MRSPSREPALPPSPARAELQARHQWVCWQADKVPYDPRTGKRARSNDPQTWASYQEACATWEREPDRYQGVGFLFHQDYTGVDLDHCVQPDGHIDPWAQRVLEHLASYAEFSPNDGIHVFLRGTISAGLRKRIANAPHAEAALEMYCQGRYFTMTGRQVPGTPGTLSAVHQETPLVVQALAAKNGEMFRALWHGDTSGYLSASEADLALCNLLAFWADNNPIRVDALFRQSGLFRAEKWDRAARAGETYGQGTIVRACQPSPRQGQGQGSILPFPARAGQRAGDDPSLLADLPAVDLAFVRECLRREEEGDARLYAHLFQGRCIYDHTEGYWYEWQGHFWKRDEQKHALVLVSNPLAAVYLEASAALSEQAARQARSIDPDRNNEENERQKEQYARLKKETAALIERARRLKTLKRMQNVLTIAQALLPITSKAWDRNPWLLACANGVLDLCTGELHPGRPEDYIRSVIPTEWRGLGEPAPRWEQFLQEVFDDRTERERADLLAFLQRLLGYGITGDVSEHVFLVLYGEEGRNGKDTIQRAISTALGELSSAISKDVLLEAGRQRTAGSATPHICDLQGKRLAWASEPEKGARFSVSQVKEYSGGGEIASRGMYEKNISKIKPTHLLILLTNHKPYANSDDKAFWDRLRLVTFNLRFVDAPQTTNERKKDTKLWQALEAEASGILAWLVRGCLEWQRHGLETPQAILSDGEQYRREQDALDLFLSACCVLDKQASVRASALYEAYVTWGKANNLRNLMTGTSFGKKLTKRFTKKHTDKGVAYQGIGLLGRERSATLFDLDQDASDSSAATHGAALTGLMGSDGMFSQPISQPQTAPAAPESTPGTSSSDELRGSYKKSLVEAKKGSEEGFPGRTHQPISALISAPSQTASEEDRQPDRFVESTHQNPANPSVSAPWWPADAEFVRTVDGLGYRTNNRQEQDTEFIAPERKEAARYRYGVVSLIDGRERFYYPRMIGNVSREEVEAWYAQNVAPIANEISIISDSIDLEEEGKE